MKLFKVIQSVLAAFIGIQKKSKLNEDDDLIEEYGLLPFFLMGITLAIIFIFTIIFTVSFILE
jgi:hypothetical protein